MTRIIVCIVASLAFISCSNQELNPTQPTVDGPVSVLGSAHAKAKTTGNLGTKVIAPGLLGAMKVSETGEGECVMSIKPIERDISAFKISSYSAKPGTSGITVTTQKQGNGTANIIVYYLGFTPEARAAFQSAVDIWASKLNSDVDIYVLAQFAPLGPGVLGSAGSSLIIRDFPGARRNTWYGNALADKLAGQDLAPAYFDIVASFSSAFPNWYFGTDGNPPANEFDFRTVVLHELGHGLNFFGGMSYNPYTGAGFYGFGIQPTLPTIFDQFTSTRPGRQLVKTNKFPNPSVKLGNALIGEQIVFSGHHTIAETQGDRAVLYTPEYWSPGSSYSHLDERIYTGTIN
ncbi:MAG TPA: hypothetical protein VFG39_05945, partial [Balneolaceae bacterium]|nr:hypothetical protein [Balneolaceae bacterium]